MTLPVHPYPWILWPVLYVPLWRAAHEFNKAADLYTLAIEKNPADPTLWCNRAYTRIKLEEHGYGLSDASTSRPARAPFALVRGGVR